MNVNSNNIDTLIDDCWSSVKNKIESGRQPLSSEKTLVFLFAIELVYRVGNNLIIDFENQCYEDLQGESKYLDLLFYTDSEFKVALEFKLPLGTPDQKGTRFKIYRDLVRLNYLKNKFSNKVCYFLMATDINSFLNEGNFQDYKDMITAHNHTIQNDNNIKIDNVPLGEIDVQFIWENIEIQQNKNSNKTKYIHSGKCAWLTPMRI